jgi:hypothetical protein
MLYKNLSSDNVLYRNMLSYNMFSDAKLSADNMMLYCNMLGDKMMLSDNML